MTCDFIKLRKKTLDDLLSPKEFITGKEVIKNLKELESQRKLFEEAVEFERGNGRG
jgi:hypothetical protein